ncbi:hypothetical protein F511_05491 [Dorcoceras hygrometricum]|uniref:Uncharacterized protein n=1 Tax=Dorcoceras hygrometricum TaxID=472368 RepID=A0A2Z7BBJ7_9LAMI|nr:hypothetical protein F511_05491 [Dorcoceras hygrometricum]
MEPTKDGYKGVGIHSQVRKIKQEMEKINSLELQPPETRPAPAHRQERSRSPLGLTKRPPSIPVGNC